MRGRLILHVIPIASTRMIEAGIDGLSRVNNLVGIMRVLNHLPFIPLDQGSVVRSANLEPWISTWWVEILISISAKDWYEHKEDNILWDPPPSAAEAALELLLQSRLHQPYKSQLMVFPWLMKILWRNQMGN